MKTILKLASLAISLAINSTLCMSNKNMLLNETSNESLINDALSINVDINTQDKYGETALIKAASNKKWAMVKLLLNAKANPNIKDNKDETALKFAVLYEQEDIVKLLLDFNADPNIQPYSGITALILAKENLELIKLLLNASADLDLKTRVFNATALDIAQKNGHFEVAEMLRNEPKRRQELPKKTKEELNKYLPTMLSNLVYEYVVPCPKALKQEN